MIVNRRRYSFTRLPAVTEYVQNGLVFEIEGQDYNGGSTWVARKSGYSFTLNGTTSKSRKAVNFNKGGAISSSCWSVSHNAGTIEYVAYRKKNTNTAESLVHTGPSNAIQLCTGSSGLSVTISNTSSTSNPAHSFSIPAASISKFTCSANMDRCCYNGESRAAVNGYTYARHGTLTIGSRKNNAYWFYGDVYSVRVYNRKLSADEILHNQKIDNHRFGLKIKI